MRSPTTREWVLLSLFGVIGVGLLYFNEGNLLSGGASEVGADGHELLDAPVVNLSRLAREADSFDRDARDLFKYGPPPRAARPPQPPPIERPTVTPTRPAPAPPVRKPPDRTVSRPEGPLPPKPNFSYLGFLGPKDDRIFVFLAEGKEKEVVLARVGEVVLEEFKVVEFKYEAVVMGYTDDRFADMTTELTWNR